MTEHTEHDVVEAFHPAVREWFRRRFGAPTDAQVAGWPRIREGGHTLLAAPTGSGKTLAAFMVGIDALLQDAARATLEPGTAIVYVSPLKALGNDIQRNLEEPLAGIAAVAAELGYELPTITTGVRTGDTPQSERQAMVRRPPHILITTPESLYLLLTAERGRETLRHVRTVIVDEIHALARDRRGSHLALSLARLDHIAAGDPPARLGLSATQRPIEEIARFLVGHGRDGVEAPCTIVDLGHQRDIELHIEVPPTDLEAVPPREQFDEIYDRLCELIAGHRTTLIFVNTRRMSERVAHELAKRLGEDSIASHHGSLSRERRLRVEQRLKAGELKALVATASLELGIDIGAIDLVCQVGSPRSIATFLQRIGRSGHALGLRPHGRIFPTTRDELIECAALVRAARAGRLDRIWQPVAPLDVLAQQIVAESACEEWREDDLFALFRSAAPFAALAREDFDEILQALADGIGDGAGRSPAMIHRDRINGMIRGRRGARLAAITNGGTIPEMGDYRVIAEPEEIVVGSVNEDFAMESSAGDVFLLGSTSWRIQRVEQSAVRVTDARGAPPTVPFWLGEAPGRTVELSEEVGGLRRDIAIGLDGDRGDRGDREALRERLMAECALPDIGARQMMDYVRATRDGLGVVPSDTDVVFERFFDESGGMQLVVHAPFGQRINRAWGLALRKRFCVAFDFELQAAANDNSILLSAGPQHSWPLEDAYDWVTPANVEESVQQSIFYVPLWPTRWRWNATRALAVPRQRGGRRVPPFIQRMRANDLMAAVFPEQVGCQENVTGPLTLPDHPLMQQTMHDCMYEAMDVAGLTEVLERVERGEIRYHAIDTVEPSPMAHEIVSGRPYTYLDNAPIEERRTRAVTLRRTLPEDARDLGALDAEAIARVADEAWPEPRDAEEVHDALLGFVAVAESLVTDWIEWLEALAADGRAGAFERDGVRAWFPAEHIEVVRLLYPDVALPPIALADGVATRVEHREAARMLALRGHAEAAGVATAADFAARAALDLADARRGLTMLEASGYVLSGHFTPGGARGFVAIAAGAAGAAGEFEADLALDPPLDSDRTAVSDDRSAVEYCDRRLLARIHRYTLDRLRREIDPVSAQDFMRFLLRWQHATPATALSGRGGLREVLARLQGYEAPASAWESELIAARVRDYQAGWLDELCLAGEVAWARLTPRRASGEGAPRGGTAATRATPVTLALRSELPALLAGVRAGATDPAEPPNTGAAGEIYAVLETRGALFFDEIVSGTRRLASDVEQGLRELIAGGFVAADGFQGLREIAGGRRKHGRRSRLGNRVSRGTYLRGGLFAGGGPPGRWSLVRAPEIEPGEAEDLAEHAATVLLQRYGVVFRDLARQESVTVPWREILRALRRFEARGTARGGRFVAGFVGEQYALPEAVALLRRVRREPTSGERVTISAVDPLNLTGIVIHGSRIPAQAGRSIVLIDGLPEDATANLRFRGPGGHFTPEPVPAG
ncbi:MAG: DEAD/DEAH box helicase [Chloroflexi bacterium]|nr:DEAD/DEAH box helicase [Chloroflexota bacterium]